MSEALRRALSGVCPGTREELRGWLRVVLGIEVPEGGVCEGHTGPMDYLERAFFERGGDLVVWANRGGGKTFYGAVATLLDMLFKPGIRVRILGGSLDQSSRMYEHLAGMFDREGLREWVDGKMTQRGFGLVNGSEVTLLSQSERSVRGQRVQKLRCDEVELFTEEVWEAAQFVTRSGWCGGWWVPGRLEVFSTMHRPFGLMHRLVEREGVTVVKWCVLDVLERCAAERECVGCGLEARCGGKAKEGRGFIAVDDALRQQGRSSVTAFGSEMLCERPSRDDAVYGAFEVERHVGACGVLPGAVWIGGMDFGVRSPLVMLWAQVERVGEGERVWVMDEYVVSGKTVPRHLEAMAARGWPELSWVGVDPAGNQRNEHSGTTTVGLLREAGYRVRSARRGLMEGVEGVRRLLDPAGGGGPGLMIHPRCERLIEAMVGYHFDARRAGDGLPVKDGHDHAADALRYMVQNMGGWGKVAVRRY